ncbi:MAG: tRNA lysidine(34) synthetase TilS [Vulcanibacillus sp.]
MLKIVENTIQRYKMVENSGPIVVGVSGGSDSMALLDILSKTIPNKLIVAHLNHKFRGVEANDDAEFVKQECATRGMYAIIKEVDVPKYMEESNLGAQEAARKVRYQFYLDVAKNMDAEIIALGHHLDDQAETILMRIIRGTGLYGLSGIPYIRNIENCKIIRPLLDVQKMQIEDYCKVNNVDYINDKSNYSTKYFRNEVRINTIPFLSRYNNKIVTHLYQLGKIAQDENNYLNRVANVFLRKNLTEYKGTKNLDINLFQTLDVALQRRVIHLILKQYNVKQEISYSNIESIIKITNQQHPSKSLDLSGIRVYRQYKQLIFSVLPKGPINLYKYELSIPFEKNILEINKKIIVFIKGIYEQQEGLWEVFDYDQFDNKLLVIRSKEDGDKIELKGLQGSKKVKKLYIDLKIPREIRNSVPIIELGDKIIWLPGVKRSKHAVPNESTKQFLYIVISDF